MLLTAALLIAGCGNGSSSFSEPQSSAIASDAPSDAGSFEVSAAAHAMASDVLTVESIRLTAADHYLDLRYRVLNEELANEHLGPGVESRLIDEKTGTVLPVPSTAKLGPMRQTRSIQKPDREYFILFANMADLKPGSVVTAEIGDLRFENLTVE